jgi:hypothetical protein
VLSGHWALALVQATAPLTSCMTSIVAASTLFTRCSAASRRALRTAGETLHKQRYLALEMPVGFRVCSHNQRDCTNSRLPSRREAEMALVDIAQLGVDSRSVYMTLHYSGLSIHRHRSAPSEAPYEILYNPSPSTKTVA